MVPSAEHHHPTAAVQFSSFLTHLKAPPSTDDDRMRLEEEQQWASPTSIATHPTDGTATSSPPVPSFTLDPQSSTYYGPSHLPLRQTPTTFATPTAYYAQQQHQQQQQLLPPRGPRSTITSTAPTSSWTGSSYTSGGSSPLVLGDYLHPQHPSQHPVALHPLVLQHSEPLPRANDDDLAMDAQMLREVLQEMPPGHHHATLARGPAPMPGLQLLFASPLHSTDLNATASQQSQPLGYYSTAGGMTTAPADMLLPMGGLSTQPAATLHAAPVAPLFPSLQTPDRTGLPGSLPPATAMLGMTGGYDALAAAIHSGPMILPRKKRTTATRICKIDGCTKGIRSRGLCKAHGGGRRCTTPGCTTSDQGGGHCVLHGGGRRCRIEDCKKSAQWRGVCKMHGGARRCRYGQCTKNGQVKQGYCRMHHNLLSAQRQQQEHMHALPLQHLQPQPSSRVPAAAAPVKRSSDDGR